MLSIMTHHPEGGCTHGQWYCSTMVDLCLLVRIFVLHKVACCLVAMA